VADDETLAVHRGATVVDGHCDIPLAVNRAADARVAPPALDRLGVGRAIRDGAVDVVISPVYVEIEYLGEAGLRRALLAFARMAQAVAQSAEAFTIAHSAAGLREAVAAGRTALLLGLEGCAPLGYDPELLEVFVRLGARVIGLTWNERNPYASGARQAEGEGLTPLGRALVRAGEQLGVVFDVSHLNERSFWDLLEVTRGPVVASHSNCHALFAHPRNLRDDQIRAIADRGGIVSLMIQSFVLSPRVATLDEFLRHVDHAVEVAGIERVGFGYDFVEFVDGLALMKMDSVAPEAPPAEHVHQTIAEIRSHDQLPALTAALLRHGYSRPDVARLMGGNWYDFLLRTLR